MRAANFGSVIAGVAALWLGCSKQPVIPAKIPAASVLAAGDACSQDSDCGSGLCLGLHCCTAASCGTDPSCQGTSCDATGACVYPSAACGVASCDAATYQLTTSSCSQGACVAAPPSTCPDHLTCASTTACRASCVLTTDCVLGFFCSSGACSAQVAAGAACASNDACATGICGTSGSGHCCTASCATGDPYGCAATDCDASGTCVYPVAGTSCVALACSGHVLTEAATCDGAGACAIPTPATTDCVPYACGSATACATNCFLGAQCWDGFCQEAGVCCNAYASNTILVDGTLGVDQACCGSGPQAGACATIAYAAKLAVETGVVPITVSVVNPPNGKDWTADTFPIVLDQGVNLSAPGLYFSASSQSSASELFRIENAREVANPAPSILGGSSSAPIYIGFDSLGNSSETLTDIQVGFDFRNDLQPPPVALDLLNAQIQVSGGWPTTKPMGIVVGQNATLTLGTDGLGASGTVWIDAADGGFGECGIQCGSNSYWPTFDGGSWVNDTGSAANPSVWIQHQDDGLTAYPGCDVNLTSSPRFGTAPNDAGTCDWDPSRADEGVVLYAGGGVINNATFQCNADGALFVGSGFSGDNDLFELNPVGVSVQGGSAYPYGDGGGSDAAVAGLTNSTFRNNQVGMFVGSGFSGDNDLFELNQVGVSVQGGSAYPYGDGGGSDAAVVRFTNSTFRNNQVGMDVGGSVDLSGGGNSFPSCGQTRIALHVQWSSVSVNAENVAWDVWDSDAGHTEVWRCEYGQPFCSCSGASTCPSGLNSTPSGDGPIVYDHTSYNPNWAAIDDANGSLSANACP